MTVLATQALNTPTYVRLRERLREDIVSGLWPLGRHVTLSELAAHYGVSGNPIREALLHLQGDGIIEMRMHRGAVIPEVNRRFVENVYDLNAAIGVMLIREVVPRLLPRDLEAIAYHAQAFEEAAAASDTVASVGANRAFHRCINAIADNRPAIEILEGRSSLIDAARVALGYRPGRLDEVIHHHREIVQALERKNVAAAAKLIDLHVRSAKRDLLARMEDRAGGRSDGPAPNADPGAAAGIGAEIGARKRTSSPAATRPKARGMAPTSSRRTSG